MAIAQANDKFRANLRSTWISDPAAGSLLVDAVPDNTPTIVVVGWGTEYETVFSVTASSGSTAADYALTGVVRLRGYDGNLAANLAVNCLNNEEFFNQYSDILNDEYIQMEEQASSPATPATDSMRLYAKTDGKWYSKNDAGTENELGAVEADEVNIDYLSRQAIINGNFDVWQRGTTITATANGFVSDRWKNIVNNDGGTPPTITATKQELTLGDIDNSINYLRITANGAGSGYGTNAQWTLRHYIENGVRLLAGTGNQVTMSFWARSDISGKKMSPFISQFYGTGGSPTTEEWLPGTTITLTSTWTKYTQIFTLNTIAGKTFGTNTDSYLNTGFALVWGTDVADLWGTEASAEDWGAAGDVDIAQVQLCAGSVALPFQPKSYAQELADCQRYYEESQFFSGEPASFFQYRSTTSLSGNVNYNVAKRVSPNVTISSFEKTENTVSLETSGADYGATGVTVRSQNANISGFGSLAKTGGSNFAAAARYWFRWEADAEL